MLISLYATVTKGAYLAFGAGVVVIAVIMILVNLISGRRPVI